MNCGTHTDKASIAQCANCGIGVCSECESYSSVLKPYYGILCPNCFKQKLNESVKFLKKEIIKDSIRLGIESLLWFVGFILIIWAIVGFATNQDTLGVVLVLILGILIAGIFQGIQVFWAGRKERQVDDLIVAASSYDGYTLAGGLIGSTIGKIIAFFLNTVLGVFLSVYSIIKMSISLNNETKTYKMLSKEQSTVNNVEKNN